jgi:hypothetical protein
MTKRTSAIIGAIAVTAQMSAGCTTVGSMSARQRPAALGGTRMLMTRTSSGGAVVELDNDPRCDELDGKRRTWGAIAAGTAVVAGGGGVGAALSSDKTPQQVSGFVGAGIAVFAAVSAYLANDYAADYKERRCIRGTP